jgi:hypothetical protein
MTGNPYLVSPNTVLANALSHPADALAPHVRAMNPDRITLVVGTQINGVPHLGTSLVQTLTFVAAAQLRARFGVEVSVAFHALDNAPYEIVEARDGTRYQRAYAQALGRDKVAALVADLYEPLLVALGRHTAVPFTVETYSRQQAGARYRETWLRLLPRIDVARWWLAPSTGVPHVRVPCPTPGCGWAQKHAEDTTVRIAHHGAVVSAVCCDHGRYETHITATDGGYLDLATLYRNLVKELAITDQADTLHVMVKGGDWVFGSHLVDGALGVIAPGTRGLPARLFCPQILTATGAKLSKSLIREGTATLPADAASWMFDTRTWPGSLDQLTQRLLTVADILCSDPRHFFRAYSADEIGRLMD